MSLSYWRFKIGNLIYGTGSLCRNTGWIRPFSSRVAWYWMEQPMPSSIYRGGCPTRTYVHDYGLWTRWKNVLVRMLLKPSSSNPSAPILLCSIVVCARFPVFSFVLNCIRTHEVVTWRQTVAQQYMHDWVRKNIARIGIGIGAPHIMDGMDNS